MLYQQICSQGNALYLEAVHFMTHVAALGTHQFESEIERERSR